jgi:hypothetical protein
VGGDYSGMDRLLGSEARQRGRDTTSRKFEERMETIMKKSHQISTLRGRPGVKAEVIIQDGDDWYCFRSIGFDTACRPTV